MKIGMECEGELSNIESLFLDCEEFKRLDLDNVTLNVGQIYISDHNNELDLFDIKLGSLYDMGLRVVVERTAFISAPYYVEIMLCIDNLSFWNLRGHDHIKFSKDLNVYAIRKKSMPYTDPANFAGDITL